MRIAILLLAAAVLPLQAQIIKMPASLDALAAKAENYVDVTLDKSMLRLAGRFLKDDEDEVKTRKLIAGLDGIYVRSFEFADDNAYSKADVEAVRAQLQSPAWSRVVGVRCKRSGGDVDIYFKNAPDGQIAGVVIIAAEKRELTIVNIEGPIDLEHLCDLGGEFHIPELNLPPASRRKGA